MTGAGRFGDLTESIKSANGNLSRSNTVAQDNNSGLRRAGMAMEAFSPTVGRAASSILTFLTPALRLVGWFSLAVKGIELVGEAWHLGNEKLAEYVALSEKASASGLSTDFYQRISKAAEDAKLPVDALTGAFRTLTAATTETLGGTSAQNRLNELISSKNFNGAPGNFAGNTGIGELANANTTEQRFKAIADLIDQAMQKGRTARRARRRQDLLRRRGGRESGQGFRLSQQDAGRGRRDQIEVSRLANLDRH